MSYPSSDAVESQQWFARFDRGQKGHLTIEELQELLNERGRPIWAPFDQDTVIRLARSFAPPGHQGPPVVTVQSFGGLWQYLCQWHDIFKSFDTDRSGYISNEELQAAFSAFGMRVSPRLIHLMVHKQRLMQGKIQKGRQLSSEVDFPSFIDLCITVKQATDMFGRLDTNQSGRIQLHWENYMEIVVSGR